MLLQTQLKIMMFICMITGVFNSFAFAESISLASNGSPRYFIYCPADVSSSEKYAVLELKKYLDQITKAGFIITDKPEKPFILVCTENSLQRTGISDFIPFSAEEECRIFIREGNIYLTGGNERAVLYAVYDFLSILGCRWIAPDFEFYEEKNSYVPEQTELNFNSVSDMIRKPLFKYRKLYIEEGRTHNTENLLQLIDWMPKAGYNVIVAPLDYQGHGKVKWENWREQLIPELRKRSIIIEVGGHGYQNFINAERNDGLLFKDHPEWFGMDGNGNRSSNPHMVFCTSDQNAVEYLHINLYHYLKQHPEIKIFDLWPPDSEIWCACEACNNLGNPTERHALLVNHTAQYLQMKLPDVKLECLAYNRFIKPTDNIQLDENVLLDYCPINQCFEYQIFDEISLNNKTYKENLLSWLNIFNGDISIYSYYRKYAWRSLPNIIPHYMQADLLFYRDIGIKGISVYSEPGDWFTYGLNHYVLSRLAWDPGVNVDSLVVDYSSLLFGKAADKVVIVYNELENIIRFACNIPHTELKSPVKYDEYIRRLNHCSDIIKTAKSDCIPDEVLCSHLDRLGLMVEYATFSATYMKNIALGNKENAEQINDEIILLMKSNATEGVFIPRRVL